MQGGSTITQQVVKTELVGSEQTIDRKAREAVLARRLEELMTKEQILERYLNTVYLGNGAYGVQAGAETYFGVSVGELDVAQSAFLAGMIANPAAFDPIRRPEAAKERRDLALRRLVAYGRITDDEAERFGRTPFPTEINQVLPQAEDYFVEEVKQQLLDDERLGATAEERYYSVFRGGLQIHTTLDPRAQSMALTARNDVLAEVAPEGTPTATVPIADNPETGAPRFATGAVVSVEPGTGAVRAMVGGSGFEAEKYNVTTQGLRSGGSTFKVFVLLALLEHGYVPTDSVNGSGPCSFTGIPGLDPDPYKVENFANSGGGSGTILQQTLRSSNCAYVRLGQIVGTEEVAEQARKMGITTPLVPVVSMPLGTQEVFPIDMAAAFASIAADGLFYPPYYIDRVEDRDGRLIFTHAPNPRRAESPESARLAADILEKNVQSGTGGQGPDPEPARGRQDGHRAEQRQRLVRGLHAVPVHGGLDRFAGRQLRGAHPRHRHHGRLVPGGDLGPLHARLARGPRDRRLRGPARAHGAGATSSSSARSTRTPGSPLAVPAHARADRPRLPPTTGLAHHRVAGHHRLAGHRPTVPPTPDDPPPTTDPPVTTPTTALPP